MVTRLNRKEDSYKNTNKRMNYINENFLKLEENYLFSAIAKKVEKFTKENPNKKIINLGIGDVTRWVHKTDLKDMDQNKDIPF